MLPSRAEGNAGSHRGLLSRSLFNKLAAEIEILIKHSIFKGQKEEDDKINTTFSFSTGLPRKPRNTHNEIPGQMNKQVLGLQFNGFYTF